MLKIAIVEDEDASLELMLQHLNQHQQEKKEKYIIHSFSNAIDFLSEYTSDYDIVFMDIEMPHMNGMEAAKKLRELDNQVFLIFVTRMAQYAIRGYEVDAMDFMVKPISYFNFSMKLEKAVRLIGLRSKPAICVSFNSGMKRLNFSEIYYVESAGHVICFHTINGEYSKRDTLNNIEKMLDDKQFIRSNKCYLINLEYLTEVHDGFAVIAGNELRISRSKKREVMNAIAAYLGGGKR